MPDTPSITLVKLFTYKDKAEEFSNTYHFSGPTPSNAAGWKALADAIAASELTFLNTTVSIVRAYGYAAGNENSVAQLATVDGTLATGAGVFNPTSQAPGDAAIWCRWKTDQRNSKGRAIYLRKYFHGFNVNSPDQIPTTQKQNLTAHANKMKDGTLPAGVKVCGPQGAVAGAVAVSQYAGFRQLKRTGKRPS